MSMVAAGRMDGAVQLVQSAQRIADIRVAREMHLLTAVGSLSWGGTIAEEQTGQCCARCAEPLETTARLDHPTYQAEVCPRCSYVNVRSAAVQELAIPASLGQNDCTELRQRILNTRRADAVQALALLRGIVDSLTSAVRELIDAAPVRAGAAVLQTLSLAEED